MENRFGKTLVASVISYLVSGYHGVSESELLDLLSCNNQVLLHTFARDMPCVLRFPIVLWLDMFRFLGNFLSACYLASWRL